MPDLYIDGAWVAAAEGEGRDGGDADDDSMSVKRKVTSRAASDAVRQGNRE